MKVDLLLTMNQKALDEYYQDLKPDGLLIVDSTFVKTVPVANAVQIPFTRIARDRFKKEMVANIVALGAISELSSIVSKKAIRISAEDHGRQPVAESVQCFGSWAAVI
jgi:2-oxoglutarate ferredoxin oxidoreductase subunit gamma